MRSLLFNFLHILLFALFASAITAQPSEDGPITDLGTVTNDGDAQPNIFKFCLDDDNQLVIKVNVLLDNLQVMGEYPNQYGVVPSAYDDMFVEFTVNGMTNTVPVGNFDMVTLENGYDAFSYIAESLPFDFSQACDESEEEFVAVVIEYRLVTQVGDDNYTTYPACEYQNSMFTCYVYSYAPWCGAIPFPDNNGFSSPTGEPDPVCYDEWFSGGYAAWLYCDCEVDEIPLPPKQEADNGGDMLDGGVIIDNRADLDNTINVYPSPFGEMMNIKSNNESIRQIEIYNSNGHLVLNNVYKSAKNQNISLNTTQLTKGLYVVRIATASGIKVVKVLK